MLKALFDWCINLFLMVFLFKKRNKNIWLFGSWNGETYSDNSRYLFEYVVVKYPNVEAVWITKNENIKKKLLTENKQCYLSNELIARKLRLNAGFVFFTNGITDIGSYDLSHGSEKIALWHGMPLKKLHYATNPIKNRKKNIIRVIQYIYLKLYNSTDRSITIATSKKTKEFLIESFEIKPESVFVTGQPRNDILFNKNNIIRLRIQFGLSSKERFILFIPTWRDFGKQENYLETIIENLCQDVSFMDQLKERNTILYIKPHPRVIVKSQSVGNIKIINSSFKIDTQELLSIADFIITDYSSVFIDYALLNRPIHFFVPDLNDYKKNGNDIFLNFDEFSEHILTDLNSFKKCIIDNEGLFSLQGLSNSVKINSTFNSPSLNKGEYCKTLIDTLENNKILTTIN